MPPESNLSPSHPPSSKALPLAVWLLIAIIGLAFLLRMVLVHYGLPLLLYEDEPIYYNFSLGFGLGHWHIGYFKKPSFFLYLYSAFYYLGFLYSPFMSWQAFMDAFWQNPTLVATIGRTASVLFATGTIAWLAKIGKRAFGWSVALAAAFFMAVDTTHLRISPVVISDIPALFFIMGAAWFALKLSEDGRTRHYLSCALMIALAISFKYNIFSLAFLIAGHLAYTFQTTPSRREAFQQALTRHAFWLSLFLIPVVFLLLNPTILLDFQTFLIHLNLEKQHMLLRDSGSTTEHWQPMVAFKDIFFRILPRSQWWPLYLSGLFGIIWGLWKARPKAWVLLSFPLVFLLVVLQFRLINAKYLLPIFPFWYLMAALFLHDMLTGVQTKFPKRIPLKALPALYAVLVLLVASPNLFDTGHYVATYLQPDTRNLATIHLTSQVREGDRLLLEPDTITLDNHLFRAWTVKAMYRQGHFLLDNQSPDIMQQMNLDVQQPRFVLVNFGEANKQRHPDGSVFYEMPYSKEYYEQLRQQYDLTALFAPYQVKLPLSIMQSTFKESGLDSLYAEVQGHKTARKRPGPCLLLFERHIDTPIKNNN
jgi:hypothetical protein